MLWLKEDDALMFKNDHGGEDEIGYFWKFDLNFFRFCIKSKCCSRQKKGHTTCYRLSFALQKFHKNGPSHTEAYLGIFLSESQFGAGNQSRGVFTGGAP